MSVEYSVETQRELAERFRRANVRREMRVERYEPGDELSYEITGVAPARKAGVRLRVERFVGGGFAGQVYRVELLRIDAPDGPIEGLDVGGRYAIKILLPPSNSARAFRDAIYRIGFQAPFSLQVNPSAARSGAIWQKLIRRAAGTRFGTERAVVDIHATFVDGTLGSCGEISEWVDGRVWRFEVNDRLDSLARRRYGGDVPNEPAGSPEYRAKREFMAGFVSLLHDMGAREFARQYEWWTCKSQPNVLKRRNAGDDPDAGLTAVDFRAGLALLPVLPMSPGDFKLIFAGLRHGSFVQFDRGSLGKLKQFVGEHSHEFADMRDAIEELEEADRRYRDSQIDVTHNHVRLLSSPKLWTTILDSTVAGWRVANVTDDGCTGCLRSSRFLTLIFAALGLLPSLSLAGAAALLVVGLATGSWPAALIASIVALAVPIPACAKFLRKVWARADLRRHYARLLTSLDYLRRAVRAHVAERLIAWLRAGRVGDAGAQMLADRPWRYFLHLPFSLLPAGVHRFLTDARFAREKAAYIFVRPLRLFFNADAREQWLRDMVAEGRRNHMLTDEDAERILSRIDEPFVQKYLKSLAVHVCTLPITQIVSVAVGTYMAVKHGTSLKEGLAMAGGIILAFQITPISPGSLVRGLYVVYLVVRERNFRDYNIAVFLGFFKYVGYLAFPIQMAYRYPALARFMAGHWATGAAHVVPVFGERGALLEHGVFDLFYNYPLTVRRRMRERAEARAGRGIRAWHVAPVAIAAVAVLVLADWAWMSAWGAPPRLRSVWWLVIIVAAMSGVASAIWAGGATVGRRVVQSTVCGLIAGVGYTAGHGAMVLYAARLADGSPAISFAELFTAGLLWRLFAMTLLATLGALGAEIFSRSPGK